MRVTPAMIRAAVRAEYDYYQAGRREPGRHIPTPEPVIRAMLAAALATVEPERPEVERRRPVVVTARKPGRR